MENLGSGNCEKKMKVIRFDFLSTNYMFHKCDHSREKGPYLIENQFEINAFKVNSRLRKRMAVFHIITIYNVC